MSGHRSSLAGDSAGLGRCRGLAAPIPATTLHFGDGTVRALSGARGGSAGDVDALEGVTVSEGAIVAAVEDSRHGFDPKVVVVDSEVSGDGGAGAGDVDAVVTG